MFWHMSCEFESESLLGGAINNASVVGIHPTLRVENPQRIVISFIGGNAKTGHYAGYKRLSGGCDYR
jgi:hypothetical protein